MKASEWKERTLLGLWWLVFGAAAMWLLVGSTAYWVKHGWLPPDTSGWVQAFGGLGAVVAALWVSSAQARAVRIDRQRREYHYMSKATSVAALANKSIKMTAEAIHKDPSNMDDLEFYLGQLEHCSSDLSQFSYAEFVNLEFAECWQFQKRTLMFFINELKLHITGKERDMRDSAPRLASEHQKLFTEMQMALSAHSTRVGLVVSGDHHP